MQPDPHPGPPVEPGHWTLGDLRDGRMGLSEITSVGSHRDPVPCPGCGTLLDGPWALEGARVEDDGPYSGRMHNAARCRDVLAEPRGFTYARCPACRVEVHTMMGRREDETVAIHTGAQVEPHTMIHPPPTYVLGHFALPAFGLGVLTRRPGDITVLAQHGLWHHWHTPDPPTLVLVDPGTPPYTPRPNGAPTL